MKGISAILATVLIVVITVAIIGLAYGWATGLFKMTSEATEEQVGGVTENLQKSVDIIAASCTASRTVTFTVKNTGTLDIEGTELFVFVDENPATVTFSKLVEDTTATYTTLEAYAVGERTLKIDAPAGPVEETVTCV